MDTSGSSNNPTSPIVNQGINNNVGLLNYPIQTATFECCVCMENLDSPSSLLQDQVQGVNAAAADGLRVAVNPGVEMVAAPGRRRGRRRSPPPRCQAEVQRLTVVWDPRELASTPCGHMFHRYCIEKWFTELGRKNCPSCRKIITGGKMIRLYPTMGQETGNRNFVVQPVEQPAAPAAAGSSNINLRQGPNVECDSPACADLNILHTTLVSDYTALGEQFNAIRYEMDVKTAEMESLQESHDRQHVELLELRASTGATNVKRRRQK